MIYPGMLSKELFIMEELIKSEIAKLPRTGSLKQRAWPFMLHIQNAYALGQKNMDMTLPENQRRVG